VQLRTTKLQKPPLKGGDGNNVAANAAADRGDQLCRQPLDRVVADAGLERLGKVFDVLRVGLFKPDQHAVAEVGLSQCRYNLRNFGIDVLKCILFTDQIEAWHMRTGELVPTIRAERR
jgi:hypothetical protein